MINWKKDWDNPDDAVYDGPDEEQIAAAKKRKAMREYMEWSAQLEDEMIAEMGQEAYDASQHWINNPLIKPVSKVAMFEEWEERIRKEQNERIIKLLEDPATMSNWWAMPDKSLGLYGNLKNYVVELIKEESK